MNAIDRMAMTVMRPLRGATSDPGFTFADWLGMFSIDSPLFVGAALRQNDEMPAPNLLGMASVFARNSVVYSTFMARAKLFAQARYLFQQMHGGTPGSLFGTAELAPLEVPEPGFTTFDLAMRAILDADLAGDSFVVRRRIGGTDRIKRLRPDWTTIVLGSRNPNVDPADLPMDPDAEILGFGFQPGGPASGSDIIPFGPDEVAHYHPNPNPLSMYRGMPLILAALPEIMADIAATQHKRAFFNNAATPQLALAFPPTMDVEKAKEWIKVFEGKTAGAKNAYRAMYLGNGVTFQPVGSTMAQMTFVELQGKAETRIAGVTGIHPTVAAMSEGLQGSSLNAGNFTAAARATADITLRFLWGNWCGPLSSIISAPKGTRIWYAEGSVPFLQADVQDRAKVRQADATTINTLVMAGYDPDSVRDAVIADDMSLLVHTGLPSVQLQPQQATVAFSPAGGALGRYGFIDTGRTLEGEHPLVLAYPSLFAPVSAPAIITTSRALLGPGTELRCENCGKLVAEAVTAPFRLTCRHCKTVNEATAPAAVEPRAVVPFVPPLLRIKQLETEASAGHMDRFFEHLASRDVLAEDRLERMLALAEADRAVQRQLLAAVVSQGQGDRSIHVESPVTIAEGAVHVPVTVAAAPPASVTIAEGAVQVHAAPAPNVTIERGAVEVPVHIESPVHIAEGAVRSDVHVEAAPAPSVTVEAAPPASVTFEKGAIHAETTILPAPARTVRKTVERDPVTRQATAIIEEDVDA